MLAQIASVALGSGASHSRGLTGEQTLLRDYAAVFSARLLATGLALAFIAIATHALGPTRYASLAYIMLFGTLIAVASSGWTTTMLLRDGRQHLEREGSMTVVSWSRLALAAPLTVGFGAGLIALAVAGLLPESLGLSAAIVATALGLSLSLQEHAITAFQAVGRVTLSAGVLTLQQITALAVIGVISATVVDIGPTQLAMALAIGGFATFAASAAPLWHVALWPPSIHRAAVHRMLFLSLPLVAFVASQFLIRWVDLLVIGVFSTAATVGIYAVAYQAYMALLGALGASTTVLTPLAVSLREQGREGDLSGHLSSLVSRTTLLASCGLGMAAAASPALSPVVFGPSFDRVGEPLALLLVSGAVFFPGALLAPVLILHERTREVGVINLAAAAVNVILDFLLIGLLGVELLGAALATLASACIITSWYRRVTENCLRATICLSAWCLAPAVVGATGALVLSPWPATLVGSLASLLATVLVVMLVRPFPELPPGWVHRLGLPAPLSRILEAMARLGG